MLIAISTRPGGGSSVGTGNSRPLQNEHLRFGPDERGVDLLPFADVRDELGVAGIAGLGHAVDAVVEPLVEPVPVAAAIGADERRVGEDGARA